MNKLIDRPRLLAAVSQGIRESPVVALLGARQVGKTTLARQYTNTWDGPCTHYDLETAAAHEALSTTPETLLRSAEGLVVIDEVQRVPELFSVLRPICDDLNRKAQFLLLGSASPDLIQGVSESLAGRIQFVEVSGFSLQEVGSENQINLWMRGGFPRACLARGENAWHRWTQSFSQTFLERDIPMLAARISPVAIGRFWRMLAHSHGQVWNASELARSVDLSVREVDRYRDLLEGSFMIRVLQPWFANLGKRLIKSPKVYLRDSGILHFLLGIRSQSELAMHHRYGASWEGFALEQTLIFHGSRDAFFYRTQRGAELDLLLLRRGRRWGFEFKCTDVPRTTKSMHVVLDDLGLEHLWVVYPGNQRYAMTESITALPLKEIGNVSLNPMSE